MIIADNHRKQVNKAVDTNTSFTGAALQVTGFPFITMYVVGETGTHASHIVMLQASEDGVTWTNTEDMVTGAAHFNRAKYTVNYIRVIVSTLEGAASTCMIVVVAANI